jgi:hypothetical protein
MSTQDTLNFIRPENVMRRHIATFAAYAKYLGSSGKRKMESIAGNSLAKPEIRKAAQIVLSTL